MMVDVLPFEQVFDGTVNFVPRAVLDLTRAPVPAALMTSRATHGEDGLDEYEAVPMVLIPDAGRPRRFALWRHRHSPHGQVSIQLPVDEEFQDALAGIMAVMRIPTAALVWRDHPVP